jgi:hypothetical protein
MSSPQSTAPETSELDYEPAEVQDEWLIQPEELPRRPRRRLLTPVPLALLAALLIACGFIGGVLVQKGQGGTTSANGAASSAVASRLAALKGAAPGAGAAGGASSAAGAGSKGGAGAFPGGSGSGGVTTGEVAYVSGSTLYVTDSQGNTVKVTAAAGSKVTKTVSTKAQSIRPGSSVVVLGSKAGNGSISATSISVSPAAASTSATGSGASSSSTGASGGPTTLFGPG